MWGEEEMGRGDVDVMGEEEGDGLWGKGLLGMGMKSEDGGEV